MKAELGSTAFQCPHCQTLATQRWFDTNNACKITNDILDYIYKANIEQFYNTSINVFLKIVEHNSRQNFTFFIPNELSISTCSSCENFTVWVNGEMKYPKVTSLPAPNNDLNEDIKELYIEASNILIESPKGATALLRLALQNLLKQVGKSGKNINADIKELVTEGLSPKIQQALDLVRVVGNNAVHPGQINLDDNAGIAHKLFGILNFIAEELITKPKELESLYADLIPETTQEHIKQRDKA